MRAKRIPIAVGAVYDRARFIVQNLLDDRLCAVIPWPLREIS